MYLPTYNYIDCNRTKATKYSIKNSKVVKKNYLKKEKSIGK